MTGRSIAGLSYIVRTIDEITNVVKLPNGNLSISRLPAYILCRIPAFCSVPMSYKACPAPGGDEGSNKEQRNTTHTLAYFRKRHLHLYCNRDILPQRKRNQSRHRYRNHDPVELYPMHKGYPLSSHSYRFRQS